MRIFSEAYILGNAWNAHCDFCGGKLRGDSDRNEQIYICDTCPAHSNEHDEDTIERKFKVYPQGVFHVSKTHETGVSDSEHTQLFLETVNKDYLDNPREILINAALGLAGESGEVIDQVKKFCHQGHELNKARMIDELGDIMWYIKEFCYVLDTNIAEIMKANTEKLRKRYPNGFDANKSKNR